MTDEQTAYYLYCLSTSDHALRLSESGVFVRPCGAISAVVSEVPREEFCGEEAERRMQDLAWLAPRACRHEAVVERVMDQAPVLPARFATLFSSLDNLQRFVNDHRDAIAGFLDGLAGHREWAVRGVFDRMRAEAPSVGEGKAGATPGTQYLSRRRAEADAKEGSAQWLRSTCEAAARALRQQASDFRERRVWKTGESGGRGETILNWAFLVPVAAEAGFGELVRKLDEEHSPRGLSLVLSGPWPAYSFAPVLERK